MKIPSRKLTRLAVLALVAAAPTACAKTTSRRDPFAAPGGETIRVRVENQNFNDATVHAIRGGERIRLGHVTGKSSGTFTVKWNVSLPLEFRVDLNGGSGCSVRPIAVDPGDQIWVRIPIQVEMTPCYAGKGG